jgi:5-(carboxyamino)imidazole ribonucleotide synthase
MINIIGEDVNEIDDISEASIYLYGKSEVRAGRKMGHINYVTQRQS